MTERVIDMSEQILEKILSELRDIKNEQQQIIGKVSIIENEQQQIIEKVSTIENEQQQIIGKVSTIENEQQIMKAEQQQIKQAVMETNESMKRLEAIQESQHRIIDLLSARSIQHEAELKRIK